MKLSLGLILLLSMPAMAQRMNECPVPGQILTTDYLGETSDSDSNAHRRVGTAEIPVSATFAGGLRARIFKNYRDRVCRTEAYQHSERVCNPISPDQALGRGNEVHASLYNLHNTTLRRAEIFARNLRFQQNNLPAERLESASQIVTALTQAAAAQGTPKSWEDFSAILQGSVANGSIQQFLVDEILMVNQIHNKRALGFVPMEGAIVNEGRGNGRLSQIFDLDITPEHRANRINKLLTGITIGTARKLSSSFVVFASVNGIPQSWGQFALMMKDSRNSGAISPKEYRQVTVDFEDVNRDAMGYQISAQVCGIQVSTRHVNVVRLQDRRNIDREVTHNYEINLSAAPLVSGEEEVFTVRFDGFKAPTLSASSAVNSYRLTQSNEGNGTKFTLEGSRKKVKPENSLRVKLSTPGNISTIQIQNPNFNSKVGTKVVVVARYYNGRFFGKDRLLATETYELTDGNVKVITAALRSKDVDYVKVTMQILGSPYYTEEVSNEIKVKD